MSDSTTYNSKNDKITSASAPHLWGAAEIRARLKEAAGVLRCLALGTRDRPAGMVAHWPDIVRQGFEAYGRESVRLRPIAPSPAGRSAAPMRPSCGCCGWTMRRGALSGRGHRGFPGASWRTWTVVPTRPCAGSRRRASPPSAGGSMPNCLRRAPLRRLSGRREILAPVTKDKLT